jgi:hypothetical protein
VRTGSEAGLTARGSAMAVSAVATALLVGSTKWVKHTDVLAILQELSAISGAELGRRLGVSARQGQRIMAAMAATE